MGMLIEYRNIPELVPTHELQGTFIYKLREHLGQYQFFQKGLCIGWLFRQKLIKPKFCEWVRVIGRAVDDVPSVVLQDRHEEFDKSRSDGSFVDFEILIGGDDGGGAKGIVKTRKTRVGPIGSSSIKRRST